MKQSLLIVIVLVCAGCCILSSILATQSADAEKLGTEISLNLSKVLRQADAEADNMLTGLRQGKALTSSTLEFVLLKNDTLVDWNDYHFIPPSSLLMTNVELKYQKTAIGEFLFKRWKVDETTYLIAIIPIHIQYRITNKYLTPYWNEKLLGANHVEVRDPGDEGVEVLHEGKVIFKVRRGPYSEHHNKFWRMVAFVTGSCTIVLLFVFLFVTIERNFSKRSPVMGFLLLAASLVVMRMTMIALDFPARFTDSPLFDARNFASSDLNPSLGDLFLNILTVLILCLFLFRNYTRFGFFKTARSGSFLNFPFNVICVALILFGVLYPFVVTQTIYNNSVITLSISESVHFNSLRIFALMSVMLSWVSSFFFMHVFIRLLVYEKRIVMLIFSVVVGCLLFIEINILSRQTYFWSFLMGVVYLVAGISFSLYNSLQKFQYKTFVYFFSAVLCFALNGMFAVRYFEQQRNFQNQLRFAGNFLDERDYFGEYLLHEATDRIATDAFIQTRMATPFLGKEVITQKIKQIYLSGYFNRYNISVSLFDGSGSPIESLDSASFSTLISRYDREAYKTDYEGVYYAITTDGDFSRKYVVLISLVKNGMKVGHVVIELLLKRVIPDNVYPELLVDDRFQRQLNTRELSYAVAIGQDIQYSAGDFNYDAFIQHSLSDSLLYTRGITQEKYFHAALRDANGKISIISSPAASPIFWLADFSFQVVLGIVLILILLVMQGLYNFRTSGKLYLAARIQLVLNLAFFLPLIAVSVITLNLTTKSSQEQLNSEFLSKANRFGQTIALALHEYVKNPDEFERKFIDLTTLANLDANIFSPDGKLMTTSQPLIFENNLLSPYIKPSAYKRISKGDKIFVSTEKVGSLQFYVAYSALFSPDTGKSLGILAVPFFQSAASLERMQITVLANILSIFTLVFIVLLIISFQVAKWLTAPLQVIAKTMGHISLTTVNKPLEWESDDEIGLMAKEYNQMLLKLNDSKRELERNQLERAWREIAQQVAHEIKNPITPMKLTLQQWERTLDNERDEDEKLRNTVKSLLSQVNSLNDIASSFSSFAKMPEPVIKKVELIGLLSKSVELHRQEGKVVLESTQQEAWVLADDKLLGRIFSNLILNGLQAARPGIPPEIVIIVEVVREYYRISVRDNGRGIDASMVDKVFLPHFTTKHSGSGLGLAISKQGIEQMGGRLGFVTTATGATFTVELPHQEK